MKIGIITLVSDNYGNKYQNYAVEQLLSEFGEVETFSLENLYQAPADTQKSILQKLNPMHFRDVLISRLMYQYDINCVDKGVLHNILYVKQNRLKLMSLRKKRSEFFRDFTKKNLHISNKTLNRTNTTEEWTSVFDYFVCGSDQIWNPSYSTTSELAFCSFAPEKTICFAPSFGVSNIPEYRSEEYAIRLKDIYKLSIREYVGQKIIKDLTGRDVPVLLDPTMAISVERWSALCRKPENKLPEKYIVCYFLGRIDKNYRSKINNFATKNNLPIVMLFDITTPEYYTFDPAEVLYTIEHAEYVLTDSFHGSVFSILFHKNFCVFNRNEGGSSMNSRLETLLQRFELEDRVDLQNIDSITDEQWLHVEYVLLMERVNTRKYFEDAVQCVGNKKNGCSDNYPVVYSGHLKDDKKLLKCASGGAATAMGETIINRGGCVFGVCYSDDFKSAKFTSCETIEEINRIKGSKYLETKKEFSELEKKLQAGNPVLFIGLGCDVASALAYCKKNQISTNNLYTVDILCHGPMAAVVHQRYIEDLEKKYKSKVVEFISRSKKEGWSASSYLKVQFENGKILETPFDYTDYGYVFTHYALPRCENCHFKGKQHQGDLCIGDHWGLKASDPGWNKNGVSIIVVQTEKGKCLLNWLGDDFELQETDAIVAFDHNPMYLRSRKSQGDYKQLIEELESRNLYETLKMMPEYKVWNKKMKEIHIKNAILNIIRRLR